MFRLFEAGVIWQTRSEEIPLSTMPIGLKLEWTVSLPLPGLIRSVGRVAMGFQSVQNMMFLIAENQGNILERRACLLPAPRPPRK